MKDKLAYMEYLYSMANKDNPSSLINHVDKTIANHTNLVSIVVLAFFAISTYYFLNKKKQRN